MEQSSGPFYVISLIFLLGLLSLDFLTLKEFYSRPEQIRSLVKQRLGDTFDLEDAHFDLLRGLRLENVRLYNEDERSNPFLLAEEIQIDFSIFDLLQGRTIPTDVLVHKPDLTLYQNKAGKLNVRRFLEALPASKTDRPMNLQTGISIRNGTITFRDIPDILQENKHIRLTQFDLDLRSIRNGTGVMFDGEGSGTLGNISIQGRYNTGTLSARAKCHSLKVRKELVQTFSPDIQDVWAKYRVTGPATVEYEIDYNIQDEASAFPPESQSLTIFPEGMNGSFVDFPYPLENIKGSMVFKPEGLNLELRSIMDNAEFSINGHTEGYGDRSEVHVVIDSKNVPINENLYTALEPEPEVKEFIQSLNASGTINAYGSINRQEGQEDVDFSIRIHPQGIQASYDEFPYPVKNLKGTVVVEPDRVRIEQITGTPTPSNQPSGAAGVSMNGVINFSDQEDQSGSFDLRINANELPLEQTLKKNLPGEVQNTWDKLQPQGTGSLQWQVTNSPAMSSPRHNVQASLDNCTLQPLNLDEPIKNVSAQISFENNRVIVRNVTGQWNKGTITVERGEIGTASSLKPFALFNISGKNLKVNSTLKKLLFASEDTLGEAIQNQGTVDLNGSVRWFQQRKDQELEYFLTLNVDGIAFEKILELQNVQGKIVLKGEKDTYSRDQKPVLTGGVDLSAMNVNGVPIDSFQSNFILRNGILKVNELNGRLLNGTIKSGQVIIDTENETFDVDVDTSGLNLQGLLTSIGVEERNLSGTLFGAVSLNGNFSDKGTWKGGGEVRLREAQLWKLPLFLPIFMELSLSKQEPFTEGVLTFDVEDEKVFVRNMQFESPSSRLNGKGHVGFNGSLLIYLRTKQLDSYTIPVVNWFYDRITSNLVTFKATGTLANPSVSATPLPFLFKENID